jgi:hypothetical protein
LIELFKSSRATALDQKVAEFRIFDELRSSRCARADGCVEHCSNLHVTLKLHGTNPCAVSTKTWRLMQQVMMNPNHIKAITVSGKHHIQPYTPIHAEFVPKTRG